METLYDKEFIEFVLSHIVDKPEEVLVTRTVDELGVLITVKVHPDDMGTLIGKKGQTAKSLRTILRVIGSKHRARVNFKIIDPLKDGEEYTVSDLDSDLDNLNF